MEIFTSSVAVATVTMMLCPDSANLRAKAKLSGWEPLDITENKYNNYINIQHLANISFTIHPTSY